MSSPIPMTELQQTALTVLRMLDNETASAKKALEFIGNSQLNLELFRDSYNAGGIRVSGGDPKEISAWVDVAIEEARKRLTVFDVYKQQ